MSTAHRFVFGQPDQGCQCVECKEDRIVEAAPELAKALKAAVEAHGPFGDDSRPAWFNSACAALALAGVA